MLRLSKHEASSRRRAGGRAHPSRAIARADARNPSSGYETSPRVATVGCRSHPSPPKGHLMEKFIARHRVLVSSVLSGFDRLVFRASLRALRHLGIYGFLHRAGVRLLGFGKFAEVTTNRVKDAALAEADERGRPVLYL